MKIEKTKRSRKAAALISFLFGGFGIQWFYLGKNTHGIISLCTFWTFIPAYIAIYHTIVFLTMTDAKFDAEYNA